MSGYGDDSIQVHWRGEYVFASFVIAWIGSFTSLSLMKQRTGASGWRNWIALLSGSAALGAVGIFAMHFTGMMVRTIHTYFYASSHHINERARAKD